MMRLLTLFATFAGVPITVPASQPSTSESSPPPAQGTTGAVRGPGAGFRLIPRFASEKMELTAEQQQRIAELEKETKARLEKILTPAQMKDLEEARPPRPGQGRPGPPGAAAPPSAPANGDPAPVVSPALATQPLARTGAAAPNILILVADDLGWGDVSFHKGNVPTPHLDRLAREGVELGRFYAHPVCSPTRAALLSGQMPRRFGIIAPLQARMPGLPAGIATLPATFRASGYSTSLVGKWHVGVAAGPLKSGFDHFYGFMGPQVDYFKHTNQRGDVDWQRDGQSLNEEGYSTTLIADEAIRQITTRDAKQPFFIEVAFNAPHFPLAAPNDALARHKALGARATYAAVIDCLDAAIGRILAALDQKGLRDNTIVLFFSDNGADRNGSSGALRSGKGSVFEGGIRTPCILRWPGHVPAGSVSQQPVATHDLFPTLAAAAGVALPAGAKLDGQSQWPALRDGHTIEREPFLIATVDVALVDGPWKLIELQDGKRSLFNVSTDVSETTDQLTTQPDVARRLSDKLAELKKDLPEATARARPGPGGGPGPAGGGKGRPPARGSGQGDTAPR